MSGLSAADDIASDQFTAMIDSLGQIPGLNFVEGTMLVSKLQLIAQPHNCISKKSEAWTRGCEGQMQDHPVLHLRSRIFQQAYDRNATGNWYKLSAHDNGSWRRLLAVWA